MKLEELFRWTGELEIRNDRDEPIMVNDKPLILYQRVVGDADITTARKQALKASSILRKNLHNNSSDDHLAAMPNYSAMDNETLARLAVLSEAMTIRNQATKLIADIKEPVEPDYEASLEEQEKYEATVSEYTKEREAAIETKSTELAEKRLEELKELERKKLVDIFLRTAIDSLCRNEMLSTFNSWCAYLGTYKDKNMKTRAFSSYEKFNNSASELKRQIIDGYINIELGGEDLKNSP